MRRPPVNTDYCRELLNQILERARSQGIDHQDLATRSGISAETLSRMKKRGSADFGILDRMARVVGLRLTLAPDHDTLEKIRTGDFFGGREE